MKNQPKGPMRARFFIRSAISVAIIAGLSGCGGSSNDSMAPNNGSGSGTNPAPAGNNAQIQSPTISGTVADGHLQGATVCIDINENSTCDTDEPSVISGSGGVYELNVPAGAEDKPVVADVPASAIDEDTNEPIGRKMVLSAPAGKPEFISPITTLVHQQMDENPTLDVDAAEAHVKQELGLPEESAASLFTDYVANSRDDSVDEADQFQYLHQTGQIVARLMQSIQDEVEQAVINEGVDLAGDREARHALQTLLRKEVRKLLPEITRAVAQATAPETDARASGESSSADPVDSPPLEATTAEPFNADQIALLLKPTEITVDADRIAAEQQVRRATRVSVENMLREGFYWIDVDCAHSDEAYDSQDNYDSDRETGLPDADSDASVASATTTNDSEPTIQPPEWEESCYAAYGHIKLAESEDTLVETNYVYDPDSQTWTLENDEQDTDENQQPYAWRLINGNWKIEDDSSGTGVFFTGDGEAIIMNNDGEMHIRAAARDLTDRRVAHHLWEVGADKTTAQEVAGDSVFPAQSSAYLFNIQRTEAQHILFNWYDDSSQGNCDEFNGNCNVVQRVVSQAHQPIDDLATIQNDSLSDIRLAALTNTADGIPIDAILTGSATANGNAPVQGRVTWTFPDELIIDPPIEPELPPIDIDIYCTDGVVTGEGTPDIGIIDPAIPAIPDSGKPQLQHDASIAELGIQPPPISCENLRETAGADRGETVEINATSPAVEPAPIIHFIGESRWRMIEKDGVTMIALQIPLQLRHRLDMDDAKAVLLIEHNGFVRRGAELSTAGVESQVTYNQNAFDVMQEVLQKFADR